MTTTTATPVTTHHTLFDHWIHSREEDRDDVQVFRREGFAFPVSFGRDGFRMSGDGSFLQEDVAPDGSCRAAPAGSAPVAAGGSAPAAPGR